MQVEWLRLGQLPNQHARTAELTRSTAFKAATDETFIVAGHDRRHAGGDRALKRRVPLLYLTAFVRMGGEAADALLKFHLEAIERSSDADRTRHCPRGSLEALCMLEIPGDLRLLTPRTAHPRGCHPCACQALVHLARRAVAARAPTAHAPAAHRRLCPPRAARHLHAPHSAE